jgi:hypothetical protein
MHSIKFYKLWHVDSLDEYQKSVPGEFVNLEKLPCPPYLKTAWPFLQEYRSHFSDLSTNTDYVGFVSASFAQKFGLANNDLLIQRLQANHWHPGIQKYIDHYCELTKIEKQFLENSIFYCNSFICKTELYEKAKRIYTQNLILTLESFNYKLDYNGTIYDDVRKGGCLCERLWSLTLSSVCEKKNAGIANIIVQGLVT